VKQKSELCAVNVFEINFTIISGMVQFTSATDFRLTGGKYFMPGISIDCVIFGFHDSQLKVLLLEIAGVGDWALPAGFIYKEEHIDDSVKRILKERTGLTDIFLQQFYVFGDPHRCDNNITKNAFEKSQIKAPSDNWLLGRFLTIGYYALLDFDKVAPFPDFLSNEFAWHDIHQLPKMAMDHNEIVQQALLTLRIHLRYQPLVIICCPKNLLCRSCKNYTKPYLIKNLTVVIFNAR
jgi:ADP-ribose pyrophosphatase YjhB (NUDIX family)